MSSRGVLSSHGVNGDSVLSFSFSEDYIRKRQREEDEWADLSAAIVLLAFQDLVEVLYKLIVMPQDDKTERQAKQTKRLEKEKSELMLFFKSPWYEELTAIDADLIIREAQEQAMAKALKYLEKQTVKEVEQEQIAKDMEEGLY